MKKKLKERKGWKTPERIHVHENATNHGECFTQWKEMKGNLAENKGFTDPEPEAQNGKEKQKWLDVVSTRNLHCKHMAGTCTRDRCALNVHVKHSDLT